MVDSNALNIDVDEIMRRIRAEVNARAAASPPAQEHEKVLKMPPLVKGGTTMGKAGTRYIRIFGYFLESLRKLNLWIQYLTRQVAELRISSCSAERELAELQNIWRRQAAELQADFQANLQSSVGELHDRIAELRDSIALLRTDTAELRAAHNQVNGYLKLVESKANSLAEKTSSNCHDITYLKGDLSLLRLALSRVITGSADMSQPGKAGGLNAPGTGSESRWSLPQDSKAFDPFYLALENRFRGLREDVMTRTEVYLKCLARLSSVPTGATPEALDLGCGRGEWIEILNDEGYMARGVDSNACMVEECHSRGLNVIEADAISHLKNLAADSVDVVTAFHLLEHLPFPVLMELFLQTYRVLRAGGLFIIETPNPENLIVASHNFHLDPTHNRILPPAYTRFIFEHVGFQDAEVIPLNPVAGATHLTSEPPQIAELLNGLLYGPQDYGVVAGK